MTTQAQIHTNRQNAQKSTGPKTPQGKAAASQNSIKHGLLARKDVISTESQEEFDLHRDRLLQELAPATPMQSFLAERIVSLSWRLKRTETIQNQTIDALDERNDNNPFAQLAKTFLPKPLHPPKKDPAVPELELTLGRLVIKDFSNSKVLDRLLMYERRIENSLYKTMQELQRLKLINNINTQHEPPPDQLMPQTWSLSQQPGCYEAERKVRGQGGRGKIAAGVAKATSRTILTRQHRLRALQPDAVEPVVGIRSNMQNEPNLQNPQKSITPFPTSNYGKFRRLQQPQNEPKTNPISPKTNPIQTKFGGKKTQSCSP